MTTAPVLPAAERKDRAAQAGEDAARILAAAEKSILAAMIPIAQKAIAGTITPLQARKDHRVATLGYLSAASARLGKLYLAAVKDITGEGGKLPDAPGQVSAAILHASRDAAHAFGAVMKAADVPGWHAPRETSGYHKIAFRARARAGATGAGAADAAVKAITARGLTGYVTPRGQRQKLTAYAGRAVRLAVTRLARSPVTAQIAARREALLAVHVQAVSAAVDSAVARLDARGAVARFRGDTRVTSTASPEVAKRWRKEAAQAAAAGWLGSIAAYPDPGLIAAVSSLVVAGMAEGEADALAVAAQDQGHGSLDTGAAHEAAVARLRDDYGTGRQVREAVAGLAAAVTAAAARALAASDDKSTEDETAEVMRTGASAAAGRWTDYALWSAFGAGAADLWKRAASALGNLFTSTEVNWIDSASACIVCQQNAAGSPYAPEDVPPYPAHAHCHCELESEARLPFSWLAAFLS
jgi:hypothetical protein